MDQKKLAKATAKLQQKQEKRDLFGRMLPTNSVVAQMSSASASQMTSKKEAKMEAKGNNRSQDIRIENFDISFGDRSVMLVFFENYECELSNMILKSFLLGCYYKMQI